MNKSVTDLKAIAAAGGGMVLDARKFSTTDLKSIAANAKGKGSTVFLNNVKSKSTTDLKAIAAAGGGTVVFDLS
ncbi:hypothetical protein [Paraburkholderia diazotrophica]|uniref:hypothetical protein n=1 Tax=Paraburkholderia diazotrophica TaxID=667676 RepID=UPI00316E2680